VKVSVIMPAFNAGALIGAAISSVLSQTHPDIELIVVDDGSTDDTHAIASGFGDRITLVHQENEGLSSARNHALRLVTGDFVALCDSDDILLPNHVGLALEALDAAPGRTFVTCASHVLKDAGLEARQSFPFGRIPPDRQRAAILQANFVNIFSVFPIDLVQEIGYFTETLRRCEDWEYWARAIYSGWRVAFQPTISSLYRQQGVTLSSNTAAMLDAEEQVIASLEGLFTGQFTEEELELLAFRAEFGSAQRIRLQARGQWAAGDFVQAARQFRRASEGLPLYRGLRYKAMAASLLAPGLSRLPEDLPLSRFLKGRWGQ